MNLYLYIDGQQAGPYTLDQVQQLLTEAKITAETPAWHEGLVEWTTVTLVLPKTVPPVFVPPAQPPSLSPADPPVEIQDPATSAQSSKKSETVTGCVGCLGILIVLYIIMAILGSLLPKKGDGTSGADDEMAAIHAIHGLSGITVEQILKVYLGGEVTEAKKAADWDAVYSGKYVRWQATVRQVTSDSGVYCVRAHITSRGDFAFYNAEIFLYLQRSEGKGALALQVGDRITFSGRLLICKETKDGSLMITLTEGQLL